jgi:hypothetical protein
VALLNFAVTGCSLVLSEALGVHEALGLEALSLGLLILTVEELGEVELDGGMGGVKLFSKAGLIEASCCMVETDSLGREEEHGCTTPGPSGLFSMDCANSED